MSARIDTFLNMLEQGQDNALLRFAIGSELLQQERYAEASVHLAKATEHDRGYSAAWKLLGKARAAAGDTAGAMAAFEAGIAAAEGKGDRQAAKEMGVFLKRLQRQGQPKAP